MNGMKFMRRFFRKGPCPNEYTCGHCGGTFHGRNDGKAEKEAEKIWGVKNAAKDTRMIHVCDDCYQLMLPEKHPDLVARARKHMGIDK